MVVALKGVRDQLWLQTFSEYTRRYNEIARDLPSESRDPDADFTLDDLDPEDRSRATNAIRAYFNLCSEELYLHRRKRIDRATWAIWCAGIDSILGLEWVREAWKVHRHEYTCFPEFTHFFDRRLAEAETPTRQTPTSQS